MGKSPINTCCQILANISLNYTFILWISSLFTTTVCCSVHAIQSNLRQWIVNRLQQIQDPAICLELSGARRMKEGQSMRNVTQDQTISPEENCNVKFNVDVFSQHLLCFQLSRLNRPVTQRLNYDMIVNSFDLKAGCFSGH